MTGNARGRISILLKDNQNDLLGFDNIFSIDVVHQVKIRSKTTLFTLNQTKVHVGDQGKNSTACLLRLRHVDLG